MHLAINHMCEYTYWFQHIFLQYRRYWMSKVNPSPRLLCIMWSCIKILRFHFDTLFDKLDKDQMKLPHLVWSRFSLKAENISSSWGLMSDRVNSSFIVQAWLWNIIIFWALIILFSCKLSVELANNFKKNCLPVLPRDLQDDLSFSW